MQVVRIGLDLAKYVFEVHGVDARGNVVIRKTLRRGSVSAFFANLPRCLVGMEASNGAHYWARVLTDLGHTVAPDKSSVCGAVRQIEQKRSE